MGKLRENWEYTTCMAKEKVLSSRSWSKVVNLDVSKVSLTFSKRNIATQPIGKCMHYNVVTDELHEFGIWIAEVQRKGHVRYVMGCICFDFVALFKKLCSNIIIILF